MIDQTNKINIFYLIKKIISHYYIFLSILIVLFLSLFFIENYNSKIDKKNIQQVLK